MTDSSVSIFDDAEQVAQAAADRFVELANSSITSKNRFAAALSGGSTPKQVHRLLAQSSRLVDWSKVHLFFGDERTVPADHPDSNFGMAQETLLSESPLPADNVHQIKGDGDPALNAAAYERELRAFFAGADWPQFDLIFLGIGADGHTASLFPHTEALAERDAWVTANWVEKLGTYRLTLTVPVINQAREIIFLVTGSEKAEALAAILQGPRNPELLPAQLIRPASGRLSWLVDQAAAEKLRGFGKNL